MIRLVLLFVFVLSASTGEQTTLKHPSAEVFKDGFSQEIFSAAQKVEEVAHRAERDLKVALPKFQKSKLELENALTQRVISINDFAQVYDAYLATYLDLIRASSQLTTAQLQVFSEYKKWELSHEVSRDQVAIMLKWARESQSYFKPFSIVPEDVELAGKAKRKFERILSLEKEKRKG